MDRYAVIGNPVSHSRSPQIHAAFASATAQDMDYGRLLAPLDGFAQVVAEFRAGGGRGANVTVPFKEAAFSLSAILSERARAAGAVNTLRFDAEGLFGDNTDGAGLVADLRKNLQVALTGKRILLVGAGGAARGVLQPLVAERPALLVITNRSDQKARTLASVAGGPVIARRFEDIQGEAFNIVINATSASLAGEVPPLPTGLFLPGALAYDMMYARDDTPFMAWARAQRAARITDGLGMLVEQAAESFFIWRGICPDTAPVLAMLRAAS